MKRIALVYVVLVVGCSHTKSVETAEEPQKQMAETKAEVKAKPPAERELASKESGSATTPSSPTALLKPGGAKAIQDKLMGTGELNGAPTGKLDGPTRAALSRYQKAHDLPATGLPDDATVQKLGLKADDIFKPTGAGQENPEKQKD